MSEETIVTMAVAPEVTEAHEAVTAIEAIFNEALTRLDEVIDESRAERASLLSVGLDGVAYKAMRVTEYVKEAAVKGFSEAQTLRLAAELGRLHAVDAKAKESTKDVDARISEFVAQRAELEGLMARGTPSAWRDRQKAARPSANASVRDETTIGAAAAAKKSNVGRRKGSNNNGERPADLAALKAEYEKPQEAAASA